MIEVQRRNAESNVMKVISGVLTKHMIKALTPEDSVNKVVKEVMEKFVEQVIKAEREDAVSKV